ncbi:hypothetical protein ACFE04_011711 [Oxalis oulophora]
MATTGTIVSLSSPLQPPRTFSLYSNAVHNKQTSFLSLKPTFHKLNAPRRCVAALSPSSFTYNPLRIGDGGSSNDLSIARNKKRGPSTVCSSSAPMTICNLQWLSAISQAVLTFVKDSAVNKCLLVPLFTLHAPENVISWIKGEYGVWTAFLALLVRLFFNIPVELELPFMALMMVIVAPHQVLNLRGTKEGGIIGLVIAAYLVYQHFSRAGTLERAFDQSSIVASVAVTCIAAVSIFLLI